MPRKVRLALGKSGGQTRHINWDEVDEDLKLGTPGKEIAARIGIHPDTLYQRCQLEKNTTWTLYAQQKNAEGCKPLRKKQYEKAVEGDNGMLVWLGRNRLNQSDTPTDFEDPQAIERLGNLLNQISSLRSERSICKIKIDSDQIS